MKLNINKIYPAAAIIILCFLVINVINLDQYGESVDEGPSRGRVATAKRYANAFFGTGKSDATKDPKIISDPMHPSFYALVNHEFARMMVRLFKTDPINASHLCNVILFAFGLIFLFFLAKKMFNNRVALYSLVTLVLFPRLIAHAHFNPKDTPLMIFMLITFCFLYYAVTTHQMTYWFLGGLCWGLSLSTKLDAFFMVPIFLFSYGPYAVVNKERVNISARIMGPILFLAIAMIEMYLLWPLLWKDPLHVVRAMHYFSLHFISVPVLYFGNFIDSTEMPWHYLPVYLFMVTPGFTLIFAAAGMYIAGKNIKEFKYSLLIAWFILPIIARIISGANQYNGIRHIFLVIPALALLAGVGFDKMVCHRWNKYVRIILVVIISFSLCREVILYHPFQGTYFNETVRILIPKNLQDHFHTDYWGTSYRQGIEWLVDNAKKGSSVCLVTFAGLYENYRDRFGPERPDLIFDCKDNSDYLMSIMSFPFWRVDRFRMTRPNYKIVHRITRGNADILRIYEKTYDIEEDRNESR